MDLPSYVSALRKRWHIIVGCTLLALSLAAILTALTPKTYSSSVHFFVSTADSSNGAQLAQGNTFSQDRIKSYMQLMKTPKVLQPVAGGVDAVESKVTSQAAPDTVLINTTVTDAKPSRVHAIATSLGAITSPRLSTSWRACRRTRRARSR